MDNIEIVIVTVLATLTTLLIGWGVISWTRSSIKERHEKTVDEAVRQAHDHWRFTSLERDLRELSDTVYRHKAELDKKKGKA